MDYLSWKVSLYIAVFRRNLKLKILLRSTPVNVEALSDVIELLYSCALHSNEWTSVLSELAGSIGAHSVAVIPLTPVNSPLRLSSSVNKESDDLYYRYWWQYSPFRDVERSGDPRSRQVILDTDILTTEAIAHHSYYQEFLRRYDVGAIARVLIEAEPSMRFSLAVQRAIGAPIQTEEQRRLTLLWARHLGHVLKLMTLLQRTEKVGALLAERVSCALAVLDSGGHVLLANELLERIRGDGLIIRHRRLAASSAHAQQQLDDLIDNATSPRIIPRSLDLISLPRPSGRRPLLVRAIRLSLPLLERINAPVGGDVLVLVEIEEGPVLDIQALLRQLGLSAGEARLAVRVADGATPKDVGQVLGITAESARSLLKKVFAKLDVGTQSQLSARIAHLSPLAVQRNDR